MKYPKQSEAAKKRWAEGGFDFLRKPKEPKQRRKCLHCGEEFDHVTPQQRFCREEHRLQRRRLVNARSIKKSSWIPSNPKLQCASCLYRVGYGIGRIYKRIRYSKPHLLRFMQAQPFYKSAEIAKCGYRTQRGYVNPERQYPRPIGPKIPKLRRIDTLSAAEKEQRKIAARERARKYQFEKYHSDPQHMLYVRAKRRINKFITEPGESRRTRDLLGCDKLTLRKYIESQFLPGMSWKNKGRWHIDHIQPCASFDLRDEAQKRKCYHYSNLRPLWAKENHAKSAKIIPCQPEFPMNITHSFATTAIGVTPRRAA